MESKTKKYHPRVNFTAEEKQLLLNEYQHQSALKLCEIINTGRGANDVTTHHIYNFIRRARKLSGRYVAFMEAQESPMPDIAAVKTQFDNKLMQPKRQKYGLRDLEELFGTLLTD